MSRPVEPETTLRRAPRALPGELPDETVLLNIEEGVAVRLNVTGAWLWGRLEDPVSVGELSRQLGEAFDLEAERALADVTAFAEDLLSRGLLEAASDG